MNNKQLFEQSAGKILSANQLEGVMRLHNALFEGVNPEQVADTVADAVKDALDDSLETVADQQVADDVSEVSSINVTPEDKIRLESLITSMSDTEKQAFFESLDEQQVHILMEAGPGIFRRFLNLFTKEGRKNNRLYKYGRAADKDVNLTRQLDQVGDQANVSPGTERKLEKIRTQRDNARQQMNDLSVKASKDPKEFERMQQEGLKRGSRNISHETMANEKVNLQTAQQTALNDAEKAHNTKMSSLDKELNERNYELDEAKSDLEALRKYEADNPGKIPPDYFAEYENNVAKAEHRVNLTKAKKEKELNRYAAEREQITKEFDSKINNMEQQMNRARQEGAGFHNTANVNNGTAAAPNGPYAAPNGPYVAPNGSPFNIPPHAMPYVNPEYWKQFTKKFTTMGKVSTALLGAVSAAVGSLKYIALGGAVYGGYKLYDFFAHPDEVDLNMGDGDGTISNNVLTVIKILGGAAAGRIVAKFIGFDSTTGKNVGTLLGALLVAYFMFLNNGDEDNAKDMLAEFNNSSETDQKAIMEALNTKEFANMLTDLYNENASLI